MEGHKKKNSWLENGIKDQNYVRSSHKSPSESSRNLELNGTIPRYASSSSAGSSSVSIISFIFKNYNL